MKYDVKRLQLDKAETIKFEIVALWEFVSELL